MTPAVQDEHGLIDRLAPESPIMFARARRLLHATTDHGPARFAVGRPVPDGWTILRGDEGWEAVHSDGGSFTGDTARAAVAHAVGALLAAEHRAVNTEILGIAGLIEPSGRWDDEKNTSFCKLTEAAELIRSETENAPRPSSGGPYIALEDIPEREHLAYHPAVTGPPPPHGGFMSTHRVFEMAAYNLLPEPAATSTEVLPVGTLLDGYGDTDEVFLYEIGTPFSKRGLPQFADRHRYRVYELQHPMTVYPAFPFEKTTVEMTKTTTEGRGYYLVDTISVLLASGHLTEAPIPGRLTTRPE